MIAQWLGAGTSKASMLAHTLGASIALSQWFSWLAQSTFNNPHLRTMCQSSCQQVSGTSLGMMASRELFHTAGAVLLPSRWSTMTGPSLSIINLNQTATATLSFRHFEQVLLQLLVMTCFFCLWHPRFYCVVLNRYDWPKMLLVYSDVFLIAAGCLNSKFQMFGGVFTPFIGSIPIKKTRFNPHFCWRMHSGFHLKSMCSEIRLFLTFC